MTRKRVIFKPLERALEILAAFSVILCGRGQRWGNLQRLRNESPRLICHSYPAPIAYQIGYIDVQFPHASRACPQLSQMMAATK
jgi:hypothetical protein